MDATRRTVLLVEDDDATRRLVRGVLERDGWTVVEAADGIEAVELVAADPHRFVAVVSDVVMPRMGGPAAAAVYAETRPDLPVLFMSSYMPAEPAADATTLRKPFRSAELIAALRALVSAAA